MALTVNFTSSESLSSPNLVTFEDTSTGTDVTIVNRRIIVRLANGNYLTTSGESTTEAYENWDYAESEITLDLLERSTSANVTVEWWSNSARVYTKTILMQWDLYDYLFLFELLSSQTSAPIAVDNQGYWPNTFKMVTNLFQSESAVENMDDLYSAQGALDRNYYLITHQSMFF